MDETGNKQFIERTSSDWIKEEKNFIILVTLKESLKITAYADM
jgi:hypothetical protein